MHVVMLWCEPCNKLRVDAHLSFVHQALEVLGIEALADDLELYVRREPHGALTFHG